MQLFRNLIKQLSPYLRLMRFDKPIGILLLLWPALWALWLAGGSYPKGWVVVVFMFGVVIMRAAGCVINDIADRQFDGYVSRTANRPLASGEITVKQALVLFMVLMMMAFFLVLTCNWLTIALAFVGAMLAACYPFLKRITHLPQLGLGLAFSWSVPMVFAAQTNHVPMEAWLLFAAASVWPVIYDTFYAMTDRSDDIKIGIKSTAILFGSQDRFLTGLLQSIFLVLMLAVQHVFVLSPWFNLALLLAGCLFVYQQYLISSREPSKCFAAFLNNNWVGLIVFIGILMSIK